jgi:hypothetical protein
MNALTSECLGFVSRRTASQEKAVSLIIYAALYADPGNCSSGQRMIQVRIIKELTQCPWFFVCLDSENGGVLSETSVIM